MSTLTLKETSQSKKHILSIHDFSKNELMEIFNLTAMIKSGEFTPSLNGKLIASCFFESSTRTRLSFDAAAKKLNCQVIGFANDNSLSTQKGESFLDTMKTIESYADLIILRHPKEGAARFAADHIDIPLINAGDGANEHPSQTLTDLFTIFESLKNLDNLSVALMGDLFHARTIHSLLLGLLKFSPRIYLIGPRHLTLRDNDLEILQNGSIIYSFHEHIKDVIDKVDILYLTRLQKERHTNIPSQTPYSLHLEDLKQAKEHLKILHPLPRGPELPKEIDNTCFAHYFQQAKNGLYLRQSLLYGMLSQ